MREARIERQTAETAIAVRIDLDGRGERTIATGVGFFDHMLDQLARHGGFDLTVRADGDRHVDDHHTVEDVGIALGQAVRAALGDRRGIVRYGHAYVPLDEALARAVVDVSGRPFLAFEVPFRADRIGSFDTQLVAEFFRAFATNAAITLHVTGLAGINDHHVAESCFKAVARALRAAVAIDPAEADRVPSTKGRLVG